MVETVYCCWAVPPCPSSTCSKTAWLPKSPCCGRHVRLPLTGSTVMPAGPVSSANLSASLSGSLAAAW